MLIRDSLRRLLQFRRGALITHLVTGRARTGNKAKFRFALAGPVRYLSRPILNGTRGRGSLNPAH